MRIRELGRPRRVQKQLARGPSRAADRRAQGAAMNFDSVWWFVATGFICGWHALFLLFWRRESRERLRRWGDYDAASQRRHDEFIVELRRARRERERGQS